MTLAIDWPKYDSPSDLGDIESVPLAERNLPATTYDLLARAAGLWPNKQAIAVLPDARRWQDPVIMTFAELQRDVHRFANDLHRHGVRRHDPVALLSPNCASLITATLAAELAGIAAPINPGLSREHIERLLERSGCRVMIAAGPDLDAAVWQVACELAEDGVIDSLFALRPTQGDEPGETGSGAEGVIAYVGSDNDLPSEAFVGEPPRAHDIASIFHTGGTTGLPKLAAHTHANEVTDAWMIAANTLLDDDAVAFAALPLFHVNALVVTLLAPLFKGQTVLWAGPLGYRDVDLYGSFWRIVERYKVSVMSAVPTVYAVLAQCPVDADIASMKFAMVGASALPSAVRRGFESHTGVILVEGYGLTEATCASARSFPDSPKEGSVGQRLPYQKVKVVDVTEDGTWRPLRCGEVGTLVISGPCVFPGYITGRVDGQFVLDGQGKLVDGWLDTGDLARIDEDGFIFLTGRAKDLIIRGGHNIDPTVIEDALLSHPSVVAAAAVGQPDVHSGEVPVAYVVISDETSPDELRQWARQHVAEQAAAPKQVTAIDALPVTDVGKPYKLALRARATEDAIGNALAEVGGVAAVTGEIQDGSVHVRVSLSPNADEHAVMEALDGFTVPWEVVRS